MNEPKLLDLAKQTIENCCDCSIVDPETNETLAIGMQLNNRISIMHYEDAGKVYVLEEKDGEASELFEVTEEFLSAFQALFECINELKEMEG